MTQKISIVILACVVVLVSAVLSGCGSSNPTNVTSKDFTNVLTTGNTTGTGTYGSLTLSGTGAATTGTTFTPLAMLVSSNPMATSYGWYSTTGANVYPLTSIGVILDASGAVSMVVASRVTSATVTADAWGLISTILTPIPSASLSISTAARTMTFNNVTIPSMMMTGTSLTLNGTLKY